MQKSGQGRARVEPKLTRDGGPVLEGAGIVNNPIAVTQSLSKGQGRGFLFDVVGPNGRLVNVLTTRDHKPQQARARSRRFSQLKYECNP